MSVLKYKDPKTGAYKITRTVKVVNEGGGVAEQLTASGGNAYITMTSKEDGIWSVTNETPFGD